MERNLTERNCSKEFFVYTALYMAKRASQDIKNRKSRSRKTKKRLVAKFAMIAEKRRMRARNVHT